MSTVIETTRKVEAGGRTIGLWEDGKGDPLFYLHGFADLHGVKAEPFPFHESLAEKHHVIAPAHPGCGETEEYPDLETVEDVVYHYLELFDALKLDSFDLVGHCVGGWIAAEIAVRHSERVRSLTLIGDVFMMAQPARGVEYADLRHMLFRADDHPLAQALFPDGRGDIEDELRRYQMLRFSSFIGFKPPYFYHRALVNRLHRVTCPALVVTGEQDGFVPVKIAETYANKLPGAKPLAVVKGAGHAAHLEEPDRVGKLVGDFLV